MQFSEKLRARRQLLGLSRAELASRLGVSAKAVESWEQGWRIPSSPSVTLLCGVLCWRREDLFDKVDAEAAAVS